MSSITTKTIKAELTIPTAVYSNIKPIIDIDVPSNLYGVELVQYLWDTYHNIFERPAVKNSTGGGVKKSFYADRDSDRPGSLREPVAGFSEEDEKVMKERAGGGTTRITNVSEVF